MVFQFSEAGAGVSAIVRCLKGEAQMIVVVVHGWKNVMVAAAKVKVFELG